MFFSFLVIMQEVRPEKCAPRNAEKFPPPATGILVNFERRWLGMMTKMKKMNVLIYQVTRFARDNNFIYVFSRTSSDLIIPFHWMIYMIW